MKTPCTTLGLMGRENKSVPILCLLTFFVAGASTPSCVSAPASSVPTHRTGQAPSPVAHIHWSGQAPSPVVPIYDRRERPVFLRELYSLERDEDYQIARALGFNAVIGHGARTFELAARVGFYVTEASWYHRGFDPHEVRAEAEAFRHQPWLISYNLNDEPDLRTHIAPPAVLDSAATVLRRYDPGARTSVTLAGTSGFAHHLPAFAQVVDIVRVDPYPLIANQPLDQVRELVEYTRRSAPDKPVIAILQAWTWPAGTFPTGPQLQQMAWQSLIAGAAGLSYYDWNDAVWCGDHPDILPAMAAVNHWIDADLEPFLVQAERYPPVADGDVYAGLWRLSEEQWRLLVVRLDNEEGTARARFTLPDGVRHDGTVYVAKMGTKMGTDLFSQTQSNHLGGEKINLSPFSSFTVDLPDLAAVVVSPRPLPRPRPGLMIPRSPRQTEPASPGALYAADLAGRPLHRIETSQPLEPCVLLPPSTPWRAAELHLKVTPADPYLRLPIFPGGRFIQRLELHRDAGGEGSPPTIELTGWHDNRAWRRQAALDAIATLHPAAAEASGYGAIAANLEIHLPPGEWHTGRDHLLYLRITTDPDSRPGAGPGGQVFERVLRYVVQRPFAAHWSWDGETGGEVVLQPRFPATAFPAPFCSLTIAIWVGDELAPVEPASNAPCAPEPCDPSACLRRRVTALPVPTTDSTTPLPIHVQVSSDGLNLFDAEVANVHAVEGRPLSPASPRPAAIHPLSERLDLDATPWARLWAVTRTWPPLSHFLVAGSRRFATETHRTWFASDGQALLWFIDYDAPAGVRAETRVADHPVDASPQGEAFARRRRDTAFGGDDMAWLAIGTPDDAVYLLQVNANGVARSARIVPHIEPWIPDLQIRVRQDTHRWQLIAAIPLHSLNAGPGSDLRLNVGGVRSIAPTLSTSWNYWENGDRFIFSGSTQLPQR